MGARQHDSSTDSYTYMLAATGQTGKETQLTNIRCSGCTMCYLAARALHRMLRASRGACLGTPLGGILCLG